MRRSESIGGSRALHAPPRLANAVAALAVMAILTISSSLFPQPVSATIIKSPPWTDAWGNKWDGTNGLDTRATATWMKTKLGAAGYHAYMTSSVTAAQMMGTSYAQADAAWAVFGHSNAGFMQLYRSTGSSVLRATSAMGSCAAPDDCVSDYTNGQIGRMKLMVFGGCYTGLSGKSSGAYEANLGFAAVDGAGVSTAIGFADKIYWPPMDKWSQVFWGDLATGHTVVHALDLAQYEAAMSNGGNTGGTNHYYIFGSSTTKLVPVGYGS